MIEGTQIFRAIPRPKNVLSPTGCATSVSKSTIGRGRESTRSKETRHVLMNALAVHLNCITLLHARVKSRLLPLNLRLSCVTL